MERTNTDSDGISRRSVLRAGALTAGTLAVGGAAAGNAAAKAATNTAASGKRGGRAQLDGTVRRNEPFTLVPDGTDVRNASCMSANSAMQTYLTYNITYCDSNDDESDGTLYVMPDEAELVSDLVYEIRSITPCRSNDLQKVAFGPSQQACGGN